MRNFHSLPKTTGAHHSRIKSHSGLAVCYHKTDLPVVGNPCLRTILLHAANLAPASREAFDFYDDEGDNISKFNPLYAELTALYYLWRNVDAPYYGLFHYRRFLDLSGLYTHPIQNLPFTDWDDIGATLCLSEQRIKDLLGEHQVILPHREKIHNNLTMEGHYRQAHRSQDLDLLIKVAGDLNPAFADQVRTTLAGHTAYYCTVFIARAEFFQEFCEVVFPIFEEMRSALDLDSEELQPGHAHSRVFGFMGERLLTAFVDFQLKKHKEFSIHHTSRCVFNFSKPSFATSNKKHIRSTSPRVSVILPCYNVSEYLPHTFECLRAQTEPNLEIIAVNDESTDNTHEIMEFYAARDPRITLLSHPNSGLGETRNAALGRCSGDYIHFFDPDDYIAPTFYEELLGRSQEGLADVVMSSHWVTEPHTPAWDTSPQREAHLPADLRYGPNPTTAKTSPAVFLAHTPVWDKLFQKRFLEAIELRFHPIKAEDIPFTWQAYCRAEMIAICTRNLYYYRNRPGSITGSYGCFDDVFKAVSITEDWLARSGNINEFRDVWNLKKFVSCAYGIYKIPGFLCANPPLLQEFSSRLADLVECIPRNSLDCFSSSASYSGWHSFFNRLKKMDAFEGIVSEIAAVARSPVPQVSRIGAHPQEHRSRLSCSSQSGAGLEKLRTQHRARLRHLQNSSILGTTGPWHGI